MPELKLEIVVMFENKHHQAEFAQMFSKWGKLFVFFPCSASFKAYQGKLFPILAVSDNSGCSQFVKDGELCITSAGQKELSGDIFDIQPGDYFHFGLLGDGKITALFTTGCYKVIKLYQPVK